MKDRYTERDQWVKYWENKTISKLSMFPFMELISKKLKTSDGLQILEVGGFPGTMLAALGQNLSNPNLAILDYFILPEKVREVEHLYGLANNSIHLHEKDVFDDFGELKNKFDLVCSFGLIEHFENTEEILKKHLDLVKLGGNVLITLPNFVGLNGLVQKFFDPDNLAIHNLKMMNLELIQSHLEKLGIENYTVDYFGKPMVWLEPSSKTHKLVRFFLNILNKFLRRIPSFKKSFLSPYIVIKFIR